jgi:hypothetical protein
VLVIKRTLHFSANIKVIFVPATAFTFGNHPCIQMSLQKASGFEDCSYDRWGTAQQCCTDEAGCVVCNSHNSRTLESGNTYYNQEVLCEFITSAAMIKVQ